MKLNAYSLLIKVKLIIHEIYKMIFCRAAAINYNCHKENSLNQVKEY